MSAIWGSITKNIDDQLDLQAALDAKRRSVVACPNFTLPAATGAQMAYTYTLPTGIFAATGGGFKLYVLWECSGAGTFTISHNVNASQVATMTYPAGTLAIYAYAGTFSITTNNQRTQHYQKTSPYQFGGNNGASANNTNISLASGGTYDLTVYGSKTVAGDTMTLVSVMIDLFTP